MTKTCIIVGASHAGAQAAISVRQGGWDGDIRLIGEEADIPYHRPPLSKDYLSGAKSLDEILLRPASVYDTANVTMMLGHRVSDIDPADKRVEVDGETLLAYDKLILCTGARVRHLPVPGADLDKVYYLRDSADVRAIKAQVAEGKSAVIIGGGYIGLETAASLHKQGMVVTVLEATLRILQRVTAPEMSAFYKRVHEEEGVQILEGVSASAIQESDNPDASQGLDVLTSEGERFTADMVIIGIGVIPNTDLAVNAGLDVENGIVVNAFCQTSDPDIYAAGDVAWHHNPIYDYALRLESVPNATEQAKTIASHINGNPKPYHSLPWFWSDQFDLKLQIAGLSQGYDDVVIRGDRMGGRSFAAFYFQGDRLLAVDAVNRPREFMFTRQVLTRGQTLCKTVIGDDTADLKSAIIAD